jgi:hypothetical protein
MKRLLLASVLVLFCVAQSNATIVNPRPASFGPDDGTELWIPCAACMTSIEGYDLSDTRGYDGSTFGFFFMGSDLSNPDNLITIFDPTDRIHGSTNPRAAIDFYHGKVYDVDAGNTIQDTFIPQHHPKIGFFLQADPDLYPNTLFTVSSLNPGGADAAATFPALQHPNFPTAVSYLLGFEVPDGGGTGPQSSLTLAFEVVQGIHPTPEPETFLLIGMGLCMMALFIPRMRRTR